MALPTKLDAIKVDLFEDEAVLRTRYQDDIVAAILRVRDLYTYWQSNPSAKDRDLRDTVMSRFGVGKSTAYSDINILKAIAPMMATNSRDFARARYNEMILETYNMAKQRKDTKTMERCATSMAKYNRIDADDEISMPYEDIVPQPFKATLDVRVLGIKPIPDIYNFIDKLSKELMADNIDIADVDFEEIDVNDNDLYAPKPEELPKADDQA